MKAQAVHALLTPSDEQLRERGEELTERADRQVKNAAKTRVQFDFTPRALARLNVLKEKTEAASYAEVVKNALKLYDGLIEEVERGSEFMIKDKDGKIVPFRMFL